MQFVEVILNLPVDQPFTYSFEPKKDSKSKVVENLPEIGKRAEIRFGNRKTTGFITGVYNELPPNCPVGLEKIRPLKRVLDEKPLFGKELIETARWTSRYYLCTFGEAVFAMIPSGRRESSAGGFSFESELLGSNEKNILSEEQEKAVQEIILSAENISEKSLESRRQKSLVVTTGGMYTEVLKAVRSVILDGGYADIFITRFIKPFDEASFIELAKNYSKILFVEDGMKAGGISQYLDEILLKNGIINTQILALDEKFYSHGTREEICSDAGLDSHSIAQALMN